MLHLYVCSVLWIIKLFICLAIPARGRPLPEAGPPILDDRNFPGGTIHTTAGSSSQKFICAVSSRSPPAKSARWFFNGTEVFDGFSPRVTNGTKLESKGAVYWLLLRKPQMSDHGLLVGCRLKNSDGEVGRDFTLTVISEEELHKKHTLPNVKFPEPKHAMAAFHAPIILTDRGNKTFATSSIVKPTGNGAELHCPATGNPSPAITWLKDDEPLPVQSESGSDITYVIKKGNEEDSGNYSCVAKNMLGQATYLYMVEFSNVEDTPPRIESDYPKNTTVYVGQPAVVQCKTHSFGHPSVTWFKLLTINGSKQDETGTPHARLLTDPQKYNYSDPLRLIILNTTFNDTGEYLCHIENSKGSDAGSAFVSVEPPPPRVYSSSDWEVKLVVALAATVIFILAIVTFCWLRRRATRLAKKTMLHIPISTYRKRVKVIQRQESEQSENSILDRIFVEDVWQPAGSSLNSGSFVTTQATTISHCNSTIEYELPLDEEWEYPREQLVDLNLEKPLGEGAFGKVVKAKASGIQRDRNCRRDENSGEIVVAVKTSKDNATEQEFIALIGELEIMKTIGSHPNIINLLGCCTLGGPLYVIVEYAPYGNLRDFLRNHRQNEGYELPIGHPCLTQHDLGRFAYEISQGMDYLASKRVIHRDLAARNILVAEDNVMKIADFGLAKDVYGQEYYRKITSGREPIKWMALEALVDRVYTSKSDIWSFGVLLWEIMSFGASPYPTINDLESGLIPFLKSGRRLNKPAYASMAMYQLMLDCWQTSPCDRPFFFELTERLSTILTDLEYLIIPNEELPIIEINQQYMMTPAREANHDRNATPKSLLLKPH